jgi:cyanamide hydratase family protein with HD domain
MAGSGATGAWPVAARSISDMARARVVKTTRALPDRIAGITVPQDDISAASWRWAQRSLPRYLFNHSVRAYFWGAAIAGREGWAFDRQVLWIGSLMHDVGLTRIPRNTMCFEIEGAEISRRFLERAGMPESLVDRVAVAIILHMRPSVSLDDGVESVLLDRATGIDVRGVEVDLIEGVRDDVMRDFPRNTFDRHFVAAIRREVATRPGCQSARLLNETRLVDWMERSPWVTMAID